MSGRDLWWYLWRLTVAGVLLAFDTRLFLFYAFTFLLRLFVVIDRLRAITRVFHLAAEAQHLALADALRVTTDDVRRKHDEREREWTAEQRRSINDDINKAFGVL